MSSFITKKAAFSSFCWMLSLLFSPAFADEIPKPEFRAPPLEYVNQHEISYRWDNNRLEKVEDILLIGDITDKKVTFYVKTIGTNHHMCHAAGDAVKNEGRYVFSYQECRLQIEFDTKTATVSDVTGHCERYFCGMMGYLQGDFVKK